MAEVFLRKASGLVRDVSAKDVLFFNTGGINIGIGIAYIFLISFAFYPGANHLLALSMVTALACIHTLVYLFFTITMPRSGGEYMYISRTLHPSIGFAISFSYTLMMMFYSAFAASAFGEMGLSSLFHMMNVNTGSEAWLSAAQWTASNQGRLILGILLLVVFGFILARGMKAYLRIQMITWFVAVLGILVMIGLLLFASRESFISSFNAYAAGFISDPDPYNAIIQVARENGYASGSFNFTQTIWSTVWPFFALAFAAQSAAFAGEIRKVGRSQLIGTTGAVLFAAILAGIFISLAVKVIGTDFLGAIAYNYFEVPEYSTVVTPWIHFLVSLLTNNPVWLAIINVAWVFWAFYWIPVNMLYITRVVFAWSFDRLAPEALGKVNRKYNSPVNTTIAATIICVFFLVLIIYSSYLQVLQGIVTMTLSFVLVGLSAVLFPFVRKDLFERSPVNYRVAGIPVMSILGLISTVGMSYICYRLLVDPVVGGGQIPNLIFVFSQIIIGFVIYFAVRAYRASKGINIDLAFKEIPHE